MRKRLIPALALVVATTVFGVAVAQGAPQTGGSLSVAIPGDPPTLDPHTSTVTIVLEIASHIAEGLYARDGQGDVRPMLATALPEVSDDGLTYTIPLRDDVSFQNGQTMTATDVVASLDRWRRIGRGSGVIGNADIEALDETTVQLRLAEPVGVLTSILGWTEGAAVVYPASLIEAAGDTPIDAPIGTGPYRLAEWVRGQHVTLERFDGYVSRDEEPSGDFGKKNAWLDEISFVAVSDAATRQAGLESGEFDVNYRAPATDLEFIEASESMYPWLMRPGYNFIALINHASPLMEDLKIRQALQATISAFPLTLGAFGNEGVFSQSPSIVPEEYGAMFNDAAGAELYDQGDPERGAELLAESSYDGQTIRWLTSSTYDYQHRGTQVAVDQVNALGVESEIIVRDWATTVSIRSDPSAWEIFIGNFTIAPEPEMIAYLNPGYLNNFDGSPEYRALMDELSDTVDLEERQRLWEAAQEVFYRDVGAIQLANTFLLNAYASDVHVEARYFLFQAWNTWKE